MAAELATQWSAISLRANHEAMTAYFEHEANLARALSERHRRLAGRYCGDLGAGTRVTDMVVYCDQLSEAYDGIATVFAAMAAIHRRSAERYP